MKYNFVYCLSAPDSRERMYFSTDSLAFKFADKNGLKDFTVECIRFYYDLDD